MNNPYTGGKSFRINDIRLIDLLRQAEHGDLQLPDFQRGWVWDNDHIVSLLASISLSYPIGAIMTLETGNPEVKFHPRLLEGVYLATHKEPGLLLLDGQQRLTSLYFALYSPKAVPTKGSRGKKLKRHYYANLNSCIDRNSDREDEGLISIPENRLVTKNFGRTIELQLQTREQEIEAGMFPLDTVFDYRKTYEWGRQYHSSGSSSEENNQLEENWHTFMENIIHPINEYKIPAIELSKYTSKEAVCNVFEKVNTGGVSLSVFELLTATYAADNFNLSEDWEERRKDLHQLPVLERLKATDFLQVVTLIATYHSDSSSVSCKRRDVLKLSLNDYKKWADSVCDGLLQVVKFLHGEYIFAARDVPYYTQLVPLGAIFAVLGKATQNKVALDKLRQWYWCGVFGEMYGGSTETRFAFDLPECVDWITEKEDLPRTVNDAQFQAERLRTLRTRNSAAYKGLYALQMKGGALDFKIGDAMASHAYFDNNIDIHHIFPRRWCDRHNIPAGERNSVVNKTPLSSHTNRVIGGQAPSNYLARLERQYSIDSTTLNDILVSHYIDPETLRQDDFEGFFKQRFEQMVLHIEQAMGKRANRDSGT